MTLQALLDKITHATDVLCHVQVNTKLSVDIPIEGGDIDRIDAVIAEYGRQVVDSVGVNETNDLEITASIP